MEFRQLEAFVATVDHRSFSAAAEALYLSQPTISSHIQALEGELQTKLIRRTTKKFEITPEGQQLYEYAVALIRLQQKAVSELSNEDTRAMEIITYLNTNSEIRNLLQYGIAGQHYTVENGTVSRVADKMGNFYDMDIYATGNAFLAYPEPGMDASIWENGKKQNRDSLVEPMLGFNLAEYAQSATQFGIPVTVSAIKSYKTTFRSELSKETFANDEVLSDWLKACDEQGKGVYVFRSRQETTSKEYDEILYFYNNTGSYRFSVETMEESKEGGGFYRNNTYIYTKDSKLPIDYGYTLTMVYDICPSRYVKTIEEEAL